MHYIDIQFWCCRYVMVAVQLVMACWMLGEGGHILQYHDNQNPENEYRAPHNLLETAVTVSAFVVAGALGVAAVTIYLARTGRRRRGVKFNL